MTSSEIIQKPKRAKRMVPIRYVLMPFAIIFVAIILFAIVAISAPKPTKKPIETKAPLVEVQPLNYSNVSFLIESQGSVVPRTETVLISEVSGNVKSVSKKFVVGGFFKKGETILTVDDISYQVALLQAKARLDSARAQLLEEQAKAEQAKHDWLQTGRPLSKAPVLALRKPQLQQMEANLNAAKADVKEAEIKLAKTKILAPYDAIIKAKKADVGQYVSMGTQVATTFAVDYAEVRLPVKQQDIDFINLPRLNQQQQNPPQIDLSMTINGKQQHWKSTLTRYEGEVDQTSRVHYIVAQIKDPYQLKGQASQPELRMGSFVKASVQGKEIHDVLSIPRMAVHGAHTINLLDENNQLHITDIKVLHSDHDAVYTQQVLPENYRLITTKIATPVEGMTLRVVGETEQETAIKEDKTATTELKGSH